MMDRLAAGAMAGLHVNANRLRARLGEDSGQGTVEYAGLAMAIGVLLIAVGSYLGGKDHGIGSVITSAIKGAVERAAGGGK
jgi:Flp pilus assembly pilin Flp